MARLRFFKLDGGKVDAAFGMDRAVAGQALPTADGDVDIKRVDLDAAADAAGALRRNQGRPVAQKRIEHDGPGTIAVYREVFVSFISPREGPRHTSRLHKTKAVSLYSNGAGALSSHGVRYTMVLDEVSRLFRTIIGSTVGS